MRILRTQRTTALRGRRIPSLSTAPAIDGIGGPSYVLWLVALFAAIAGWLPAAEPTPEQADFFEQHIRPIFVARCQSCHGEKKQELGLRLDSRAGLLGGSDLGDVVDLENPAASSLLAAVTHSGEIKMPPKEKLPDDQIAKLRQWIEMGAPWPESSGSDTPLTGDALHQHVRKHHWSLQPLADAKPPAVQNNAWPQTAVDRFILAKLEANQLQPSSPADRRTLIRRATFDLLGLPPTPEEVDAFVSDDSPDAYARLIDRLLASPAYGERWGRHWLDVARYADTKGYAFGRERRFAYAYTYRDWVIRAFNEDLPYNQFIVQQIAADHLPGGDTRRLAALGLLTVGRRHNNHQEDIDDQIDVVTRGFLGLTVACARCHDHKYDAIPTADYYSLYGVFDSTVEPGEPPLLGDPAKTPGYAAFKAELDKRAKAFDDFKSKKYAEQLDKARRNVPDYLVRVVTKREEKLLQKLPFISLSGEDLKPKLVTRWRQYLLQHAKPDHRVWKPLAVLYRVPDDKFEDRAAELAKAWQNLPPDKLHPLVKEFFVKAPREKIHLAERYGALLTSTYVLWKEAGGDEAAKEKLPPERRDLLEILLARDTPTDIPKTELHDYLVRSERGKFRELEKAVDTHKARGSGAPPRAMSVVDRPHPHEPHIFIRGNHARRGDRVPRQFLRVIADDARQPFSKGSGRLELAEAIASADNPLTARVIANRVWMHHFGQPLAATPSDLGIRSDPPTHPQLLDYLAHRLIDSGWSLKALHREIMLSAVYQQSSVGPVGPTGPAARTNTPQEHNQPQVQSGGPDLRDPENRLLWRANRRRLELEPLRDAMLAAAGNLDREMYGRPVEAYTNTTLNRRSVYAFVDRQDLPNLLRSFDFASPDQSAPKRPKTTVPQQALFLMNSPFVIAQARGVAVRPEILNAGGLQPKVKAIYRCLFQREPTAEELAASSEFIQAANQNRTDADKLAGAEQLVQLLMMSNEFLFVD